MCEKHRGTFAELSWWCARSAEIVDRSALSADQATDLIQASWKAIWTSEDLLAQTSHLTRVWGVPGRKPQTGSS